MTAVEASFTKLQHDLSRRLPLECVAFDLGGTLFDRDPLHVRASIAALNLVDIREQREAERTILQQLRIGSNSKVFIGLVQERLGLTSPSIEQTLGVKRGILRDLQHQQQLPVAATELLTWLAERTTVAVVSQGDVDESRDLLTRSFAVFGLQPAIRYFGRHGDQSMVQKADTLRLALSGYSPSHCVFVGDSLTDAEAASALRVPFIHFAPFHADATQ